MISSTRRRIRQRVFHSTLFTRRRNSAAANQTLSKDLLSDATCSTHLARTSTLVTSSSTSLIDLAPPEPVEPARRITSVDNGGSASLPSEREPVATIKQPLAILFSPENTIQEVEEIPPPPSVNHDSRSLGLLTSLITLLVVMLFSSGNLGCQWCSQRIANLSTWHLDDPLLLHLTENVEHYMEDNVLPYIWPYLQRFLLMEGWRRVWRWSGAYLSRFFAPRNDEFWIKLLPVWAYRIYDYVYRALRRGTGILLRRTIERLIMCSFASVTATSHHQQAFLVMFLVVAAIKGQP